MDYLFYLKNAFFVDTVTKVCITAICTALMDIIGINTIAYEVLFILVLIDAITGTWVAFRNHQISSIRFFGTGRKLLVYFLLILSSHQIVRISELALWLDEAMALYLASTETLSIIENASSLGVKIPKWIKKRLHSYTEEKE